MGVNKVFLIGNLTREPELRHTPNGTAVADIGLAVNRKWKGEEETLFVDCVAWAKAAEIIVEYMHKGSPIFIEGRLTLDEWQGKDGTKRSKMRVVVENFQFLGSRDKREEKPKIDPLPHPKTSDDDGPNDDDVPF